MQPLFHGESILVAGKSGKAILQPEITRREQEPDTQSDQDDRDDKGGEPPHGG